MATNKQINYIWWQITSQGKTFEQIYKDIPRQENDAYASRYYDSFGKTKDTMEIIENKEKLEYFESKMKKATVSQASYVIELINKPNYKKLVEMFRQLKIIK